MKQRSILVSAVLLTLALAPLCRVAAQEGGHDPVAAATGREIFRTAARHCDLTQAQKKQFLLAARAHAGKLDEPAFKQAVLALLTDGQKQKLAAVLEGARHNPPGRDEWTRHLGDVRVPMRDGKWLGADIHFPPVPGRYPTVLIQTPYNRKRFGAVVGVQASGRRGRHSSWRGLYDRDHYVYVIVDWRGFYGSRAAMEGLRRIKRGLDGYDCVEWIASQPWSDGKVGTWGGSALGKQQFDTAAEKPPHLVCSVPMIASMGQGYDGYYRGGVLREEHVKNLRQLGYKVGQVVVDQWRPDSRVWAYVRRMSYRIDELDVPMLMVTGWWDNYPDAILEQFGDMMGQSGPRAREHSRLVVGPWTHCEVDKEKQGILSFPDAVDAEKRATMAFFDYWLRGEKGNGWDRTARVRYYRAFDGDGGRQGRWVEVDAWPGRPVSETVLHLHADGGCRAAPAGPAFQGSPTTRGYAFDPREPVPTLGGANLPTLPMGPTDHARLLGRKDVLVYDSGPLAAPLRLLGNGRAVLWVSVDRKDADVAVLLLDRDPEGRAALVTESIQRLSLRTGRHFPVEPGRAVEVTVTMPVTAYTLRKGHSLLVLVASCNHPRYERNTHAGTPHWDEAKALPVKVTVYHDEEKPSRVILPVGE